LQNYAETNFEQIKEMQERIKRLEYWIVGGMGAVLIVYLQILQNKNHATFKTLYFKEMTKSMTAQRKNIDNTPGSGEIKSLGDLCYEILRTSTCTF